MIMVKGYQIKVTLDVHPRIWRRVQIPSNITFRELALILNTAMGWEGYHLSVFRIGKNEDCIFIENYPDDKELKKEYKADGVLNSKKLKIDEYFAEHKKFMYIYDFGDNWHHEILLEKVLDYYRNKYAQVVTYRGNCPPEDCGGFDGYYQLMYGDSEEAEKMRQYYEIIKYDKAETNKWLKNLRETEKMVEEMIRGRILCFSF